MPEMKPNQLELNHLLKAVDNDFSGSREKSGDGNEQKLRVNLDDRELWSKFKDLTNEMIVTKSGRRMFPVMRISISGLDPNAMYSFLIDFVPVESHRWKYVNGEWVPGGKAEPAAHNPPYLHPDSPNFGAHWMKEPVSFNKVKLTNKMHGNGQVKNIMLNSLHKYQPRIHIVRVGSREEKQTISNHSFVETQFVAVTAYQNEEITALKIKYNPFAKAFQDAKERPDQRDFASCLDELQEVDQKRLSHFSGAWFLPPGSHTLMGPPSQFQSSPSLYNPCDRFSTLRDHRHAPYTHPFSRRSPPHAGYPHDMSGNLPSMLNIADNWAAHMPTTHAYTGTLSGTSPSAQQAAVAGQHASYMWNLGQAASNSSCAVSQYLRSGSAYLPPAAPSITGAPLGGSSDVTTSSLTALPGSSEQHNPLGSTMHTAFHDQTTTTGLENISSSFHTSRDGRPASASTNNWGPITPPAL